MTTPTKSPNFSAPAKNKPILAKEGGIEDLELALEKAKRPEDILLHGIHLAMIKTHILSMGIPRKTTRKDIVQATASGTAFGAFSIMTELASSLPPDMAVKGKREMIAHYLEVQAMVLDKLLEQDPLPQPPETIQ